MFNVTVELECDECGRSYMETSFNDPDNACDEAGVMEEDAKKVGWTEGDDYTHLCPKCGEKDKEDADATQADDGGGLANKQEDANADKNN